MLRSTLIFVKSIFGPARQSGERESGIAFAALSLCLSIGLSENRFTLFGPML
jgi:hypothetical protein